METTIKQEMEMYTTFYELDKKYTQKVYSIIKTIVKINNLELDKKYPISLISMAVPIADVCRIQKQEMQIANEIRALQLETKVNDLFDSSSLLLKNLLNDAIFIHEHTCGNDDFVKHCKNTLKTIEQILKLRGGK